MATYKGPGQFDGQYPTQQQQTQRASGAVSNAIHDAGMKNKGPVVPYRSTPGSNKLIPTGSPEGKRWGELTRKSMPGKDIWGGNENPSLSFSGKVAQKSDYWHQMAEQPKAAPGPKYTTKATPKTKTTPIPIGPSQPRGRTDGGGSIGPEGSIGPNVPPSGANKPPTGSNGSRPRPKITFEVPVLPGRGYNGGRSVPGR
jgi:hypothetical protein